MTASKIEWTDRSDWNPIRGCTRVSPGCGGPGKHGGCYAEAMAARFSKPGQWGHGFAEMRNHEPRWTGRVEMMRERLDLPLRWKKPARIFASSTSDMFHEELEIADIAEMWAYMTAAYWHEFQVLTKRPERAAVLLQDDLFREMVNDYLSEIDVVAGELGLYDPLERSRTDWRACCPDPQDDDEWPIKHIWLGVSAEDQARADERIPLLLKTPAAVRFVSLEPLLGPIDLTDRCNGHYFHNMLNGTRWHDNPEGLNPAHKFTGSLDLVIVGGESGPHARPMQYDWARSLLGQCEAASVAYFFKQWGEYLPVGQTLPGFGKVHGATAVKPGRMKLHYAGTPDQAPKYAFAEHGVEVASTADNRLTFRVGKKAGGRLLDGVEHNAMPIREARP